VREERVPPNDVSLLVVCTGNAARSVMAGLMLDHLAARRGLGLSVTTAGTHALDGLPLSARTLAALRTIPQLAAATATVAHRSRQLSGPELSRVDLVVAMEAGHVRYVRRLHTDAAARTGTFRSLARDLAPRNGASSLDDRVAALDLEHAPLDPAGDVMDPAGHDDAVYAACAAELWALSEELVRRL
jgi:protein-tyrosine phosphatase